MLRSVAFALTLLAAAPAAAQYNPLDIPPGPRRVDVSGSGGFVVSTDWSDLVLLGSVSSATGVLEQVLARDLTIDPGPVFDGVVTYWEGRYGFRVHGGYSHSCLAVGRSCASALVGSADSVDVDAWIYDVGGSIGLLDYRRGRPVWPYFFFALGGVTYNLDQTVSPPLNIIAHRPPAGAPTEIETEPQQSLIVLEELGVETKFAWTLGIGTDVRIPVAGGSIGLRMEVSDHMHSSPVDIEIANLPGFRRASEIDVDFGIVHNLRAAVGFVVQFGR